MVGLEKKNYNDEYFQHDDKFCMATFSFSALYVQRCCQLWPRIIKRNDAKSEPVRLITHTEWGEAAEGALCSDLQKRVGYLLTNLALQGYSRTQQNTYSRARVHLLKRIKGPCDAWLPKNAIFEVKFTFEKFHFFTSYIFTISDQQTFPNPDCDHFMGTIAMR